MRRLFSLLSLITVLSGTLGTGAVLKKSGRVRQYVAKLAAAPTTGAATAGVESLLRSTVGSAARLAVIAFRLHDTVDPARAAARPFSVR